MNALVRFSEPYAATGGMASEGVRNLLGRPSIEPLELLAREAIQNSWDAKRDDSDQVEVSLGLNTLTADQRDCLVSRVLPDPPPNLPLAEILRAPSVRLLTVADRGTVGLEGGIRSDLTRDGEPSDFVDFIRNIGQPPDRHFGAGSFGYGKGAFYLQSRASTIVVHTRCRTGSGIVSRLIACALGEHYSDQGGVRRTGRHWWGEINDGVVDPILGAEAEALATGLGLPPFFPGDTGTTVSMVAPLLEMPRDDWEEDTPEEDDPSGAMALLAEAIAWNFWPKMISIEGGRPGLSLSVRCDGSPVPIPDPDTHPELQLFAGALRDLRAGRTADEGLGGTVRETWCHRPRQRVGRVSIRRGHVPEGRQSIRLPSARPMGERLHHVALMRQANLVVRYEAGPPLPTDQVGYAGVFESEAEIDQAFRDAEPPTHDQWESRFLERPERTFVNVALKRVREIMDEFASPVARGTAEAGNLAVGEFSSQLAGLIPTLEGPGAAIGARPAQGALGTGSGSGFGGSHSGGSGAPGAGGGVGGAGGRSGRGARPSIEVIEPAGPALVDGKRVLRMRFRVDHRGADVAVVRARPAVMTLDGAAIEREPPLGAAEPEVLRWIGPEGALEGRSAITIPCTDDGGCWELHVTHLGDALVQLNLEVEPS